MENLSTTNLMLGIMAAVSLLEALVLIVAGIAGYKAYSRLMKYVQDLDERRSATLERVNGILADAKVVTDTIKTETLRADQALHRTLDRVDETVDRVKWNVRARTSRLIGLVRGARVALETMLHSRAA
jgi:precorrin isomerase